MPIQYPYEVIKAAGTYRINEHTQLVEVYVDSGTVNIHLPYARTKGAPLTVINRGDSNAVYLYPTRAKTIGGGSYYRFVAGTAVTDNRVDLIPSSDSDGNTDGNWTIIGGKMVQVAWAVNTPLSVIPDTWTKVTGLVTVADGAGIFDATTQLFTPLQVDAYEITAINTIASLAAGETFAVMLRAESDADTAGYRQTFTSNGEASQLFTFQMSAILNAVPYRLSVLHTDSVNRTTLTNVILRRLV